jgi:hypothetical protein
MGGFSNFGGSRADPAPAPTPAPQPEVSAAQKRQEERAEAQERKEMQGAQRRRRLMRTGGLRLLFSPARQEGPGSLPKSRKMGGGSS